MREWPKRALASTTHFQRDGLVNLPRVFAKHLHSDASIYCYGHAYVSRMRQIFHQPGIAYIRFSNSEDPVGYTGLLAGND